MHGWVLPDRDAVVSGKYRVHEPLGVGGMGAVLRATHVVSGRQVALKWLLPSCGHASVRFVREARAAGRIDHPNVVGVYDLGTHEGGHYLVMELLRGRTLRARLRAGKLTPRELMDIMVPVLRGVSAAHAQGVIHRDLKPDNVFLCEASDGSAREPKVLDFGISKIRADLDAALTLTRPGAVLGTLPYMSPEQLEDAPEVDERADVYAVGVMMYEALAGARPFRASSDGALVRAILAHRPVPLRVLAPGISPQLERVVMRAMAKRAADRQPDVETLIRELQSWSQRAAPARVALTRLGAVASSALALVALVAFLLAGWQRDGSVHPAPPLLPAPRRLAPRLADAQLCGSNASASCEASAEPPVVESATPDLHALVAPTQAVNKTARTALAPRARPARVKARAGVIRVDDL